MPRKIDARRIRYTEAIRSMYGNEKTEFTRKELRAVSHANGWKWIPNWITHDQDRRIGRGKFRIEDGAVVTSTDTAEFDTPTVSSPETEAIVDSILAS